MEKTVIISEMKSLCTVLTSSQKGSFLTKRSVHTGTTWSIVNSVCDRNLFPTVTVSEIITCSFNDQPMLVRPLHLIMKLYLDLNINIIINKEPK